MDTMHQHWASGALFAIFILSFVPNQSAAGSIAEDVSTTKIGLTEVSTISRNGLPTFQLYSSDEYVLPPSLLGITADQHGFVYLCDAITERLIKISPDGSQVFSIGSLGEGPEDHSAYGDPIILPNNQLIRTDCSYSGKILVYDTSGAYHRTIALAGVLQYLRIWWRDKGGIAVAVEITGDAKTGTVVRSVLVSLTPEGQITGEHELVTNHFSTENGSDEKDWWAVPLLSLDSSGNIYLQPTADSGFVTCLGSDLTQKWECRGEWKAPRRSADLIEELQRKLGPRMHISPVDRSLRRIVARKDGRVWIQPNRLGRQTADNFFLEYGPNGTMIREIELEGLPSLPGDFAIFDNLLVWKSDDDLESNGSPIPYFEVFRIPADE